MYLVNRFYTLHSDTYVIYRILSFYLCDNLNVIVFTFITFVITGGTRGCRCGATTFDEAGIMTNLEIQKWTVSLVMESYVKGN